MRVQIYQEELGEGVELIETTSRNGEHFFGLRVWLKTCQPLLDHTIASGRVDDGKGGKVIYADDDRSAVTFWASNKHDLYDLVSSMCKVFNAVPHDPCGPLVLGAK